MTELRSHPYASPAHLLAPNGAPSPHGLSKGAARSAPNGPAKLPAKGASRGASNGAPVGMPNAAPLDVMTAAFEQAPIAIAVVQGADGVCSAANGRFRAFTGARPVLGREIQEAFPELEASELLDLMDRAIITGQPVAGVERSVLIDRNLDGATEEYFLNLVFQPLRDAAGSVHALALFANDVTAYVRARGDAERLRDDAAEKHRVQAEMLAVVSHELRTPLNAVAGYAELLERGIAGPLTDWQREYVRRIRRAVEHLTRLAADVTDFAQLEKGWLRVGRERGLLGPVVDAAYALVAPDARDRGVELVVPPAETMAIPFVGDELRVRQAIVNLLANALKATPSGGRVTVDVGTTDAPPESACLQSAGPWAVVRVTDTGSGLDPRHAATIFAPLMRAKAKGDGRGDGAGLGLMVSRRLARVMGGDMVLADPGTGPGASFLLFLPSGDPAVGSRTFTDLEADAAPPALGMWGADARALVTLGDHLRGEVRPMLSAFAERLHRDATTRAAAERTPPAELEAYHGALLNATIRSLALHAEGSGARRRVARDARLMQRVLAEYHGELRSRQGWSADEVSREYALLGEEVAAAIRRHPGGGAGAAATNAAEVLHEAIATARDAAMAALRQPGAGAGGGAAGDGAPRR